MVSILYAVLVYMFIHMYIHMYVQYVHMYFCVYVHMCIQDITVRTYLVAFPPRPAYGTKHFREEDGASFLGAQVGRAAHVSPQPYHMSHPHTLHQVLCLISTVCVCLCMLNDGQLAIHKCMHRYIHTYMSQTAHLEMFVYLFMVTCWSKNDRNQPILCVLISTTSLSSLHTYVLTSCLLFGNPLLLLAPMLCVPPYSAPEDLQNCCPKHSSL